MSQEDIESAEGTYSSECGKCQGRGCTVCNDTGYVDLVDEYDNYMGSKKGKKLTASDIKSKMESFSDSRR